MILGNIATSLWFMPWISKRIHKVRGVDIVSINDLFIGRNVIIDNSHPEYVRIGRKVTIATGSIILGHKLHVQCFIKGKINMMGKMTRLGEGVFIGCNTVVQAGVKIGKYSIIGPNSTVVKNVEEYAFYSGNPARLIRLLKEK